MAKKAVDITNSPEFPRFLDGKHWKTRSSINKIILHCTDRNWPIEKLYRYDVFGKVDNDINRIDPNGLPGITYTEVFMPDGLQYHCNNWKDWTWHAAGHNKHSLGIALMYKATPAHCSLPDREPPEPAVSSFVSWAARTCLYLGLEPYKAVQGHREQKGTGWFFDKKGHKKLRKRCPGMRIDLNVIRTRVVLNAQKFLYLKASYYRTQEIIEWGSLSSFVDGVWGPKTKKAAKLLYKNRHILLEDKHGGLLT